MSYEGSNQNICENGHLFEEDCYDEICCPYCGKSSVWSNPVDETNGEFVGHIPSKIWEKFKLTEIKIEQCNLGHEHLTAPSTYRIPTKEEQKQMRHYWDEVSNEWKKLDED